MEDEHEFVDILEERRRSTDLGLALRTFSPQPYRDASPCSSSDLSRAVMESAFLGYVVKEVEPFPMAGTLTEAGCWLCHLNEPSDPVFCPQVATETGLTVTEVREDACTILEEMSQNLQLGFIRLMAYTLSKVFKRLFSNIFVNTDGLNLVRNVKR